MRSRQGGNLSRVQRGFLSTTVRYFSTTAASPALGSRVLVHNIYIYNLQYNIVLLLQSVLLFPSGEARKSLFYGKQHCLETRGDTKYSRFVLFVECLAAS